jgi:omega-amidase
MAGTLTVTTIQPDLIWEDKAANLRRLEQHIFSIPQPTEVVVIPEMFSTGFSMRPEALAEPMDGPTVTWMSEIAARRKIILTGSVIIEEEGNYYNRLIWMLPNGEYGTYDKRHRFAFAGENDHYTSGHKRLIASVNGWRILLQVCYDLRFPIWSRQTPPEPGDGAFEPVSGEHPVADSALEYDAIIYVANWPERRSLAWRTLLQARAIENQSYVIGVNRVGNDGNNIYHSGDSMIFGPLGDTLYHGFGKEEVNTTTLQKESLDEVRRKFPFWRDADHFTIEP